MIDRSRITTPFGELYVHVDGVDMSYNFIQREKSEPCKDVYGRFLISIDFIPDGIMEHVIECVFIKSDNIQYTRSHESGECVECQAFYTKNDKLSIGTRVNNDGSDYEVDYLDNGMAYLIFPNTKNTNYEFGVSWICNYTKENDVQTWFGADSCYP